MIGVTGLCSLDKAVHFFFFLNLNIPINWSPNELQNMTTNELHTISPVKKLKLLPIPNTTKQKTMPQTIKVLFLFLNKSLNLCFWDKSLFFLLEPSMEGAMIFNNHFLKAFMGFILTKYFLKYLSSWSNSTYLFAVNKVTVIFLLLIGNEIFYQTKKCQTS